jgi:hypothetical protein
VLDDVVLVGVVSVEGEWSFPSDIGYDPWCVTVFQIFLWSETIAA